MSRRRECFLNHQPAACARFEVFPLTTHYSELCPDLCWRSFPRSGAFRGLTEVALSPPQGELEGPPPVMGTDRVGEMAAPFACLEAVMSDFSFESRPCKNGLSWRGAEVLSRRRAPPSQAVIASIRGLVPSTAITRFML